MSKRPLKAHEVFEDAQLLRMLGWGILDMERESGGVGFEDVFSYSYLVHPEDDRQAPSRRIMRLLGEYFSSDVARAMWEQILGFKAGREKEDGQPWSLEKAALEWYRRHGRAFLRQQYLSRAEVPERVPGVPERGAGLLEKAVELAMPEMRSLLEAGFSVVDVVRVFRPYLGKAVRCFLLRKVAPQERERYYVRMIASLTGYELDEKSAEELWPQILEHKWYMSERAGQDVGLQAAALDFFKRLKLADRALPTTLPEELAEGDQSPGSAGGQVEGIESA